MLTCKDFLKELNSWLDEDLDPQLRSELQKHVSECPNCWVVCDTTERTIKVYKGMEAQPLPSSMQSRLQAFLAKHCKQKAAKKTAQQPASLPSEGLPRP